MATRILACLFMVLAGCHSSGRTPLSMVPPASLDEKPRPSATAAPRGAPGAMLSTASGQDKKKTGEEESTYEYPIPPAPKEAIAALPQIELPPAPVVPITATPSPLPPIGVSTIDPPMSPVQTRPTAPALPVGVTEIDPPMSPVQTKPSAPVVPGVTPPTFTAPPPMAPTAPPAAPQAPMSHGPTLAPPIPVEMPRAKVAGQPVSNNAAPAPLAPAKIDSQSNSSSDFVGPMRALFEKSHQRTDQMDSYGMRMRRREVVGGVTRPEEIILAKFRKEPFSIYLKWVGEEGKNREVCYVKGQHEGAIHILMGPGENFLFAGKHMKFAPDNSLVKSNTRYPITEAGLGPLVARFGRLVAAVEKGDASEGSARYLGKVKRPEFEAPVEGVVQTLPAKYEGLFPNGGQRFWYFDTTNGLPVLITTLDERGRELEYYCHDRFQTPANLDDDDFNPDRLWKK